MNCSVCYKRLLPAAFVAFAVSTLTAQPHYSRYVRPSPIGKLIYSTDEQGNRIPDYSYAGYGGGGVSLPNVPVKVVLEPAPGDDTDRIQAALNKVSIMPLDKNNLRGAVLLRAGLYEVKGSLKIAASGVVLRGQGIGPDGTTIRATSKEKSEWSNGWKNCLITVSGKNNFREIPNTRQHILDEQVTLEQTTFTIKDADAYKPGDPIMVQRDSNTAWIHAIGMDRIPARKDGNPIHQWKPGAREAYERTVTAVNGNRLTINHPLYNAIQQKYGGGWVYKYEFPGRIKNVGIENLRAVSVWEPEDGSDPLTHSAAMVQFFNATDCWASDLTSIGFYGTGILVGGKTRDITIQDCTLENAEPRFYEAYRYVARYGITLAGQGILVQRCKAFNCRHAFSVSSRTAGANVFLDCDGPSKLGASEPHHRWSTGVLFDYCGHNHATPILIMNRGSMGSGHGWTTGNSLMWNCIGDPLTAESPPIAKNYSIGCKGQRKPGPFEAFQPETYESWGRHVVPASLYLAQLKDRLGPEAVRNVASREQLERNLVSVKDQDNNSE